MTRSNVIGGDASTMTRYTPAGTVRAPRVVKAATTSLGTGLMTRAGGTPSLRRGRAWRAPRPGLRCGGCATLPRGRSSDSSMTVSDPEPARLEQRSSSGRRGRGRARSRAGASGGSARPDDIPPRRAWIGPAVVASGCLHMSRRNRPPLAGGHGRAVRRHAAGRRPPRSTTLRTSNRAGRPAGCPSNRAARRCWRNRTDAGPVLAIRSDRIGDPRETPAPPRSAPRRRSLRACPPRRRGRPRSPVQGAGVHRSGTSATRARGATLTSSDLRGCGRLVRLGDLQEAAVGALRSGGRRLPAARKDVSALLALVSALARHDFSGAELVTDLENAFFVFATRGSRHHRRSGSDHPQKTVFHLLTRSPHGGRSPGVRGSPAPLAAKGRAIGGPTPRVAP